MCRLRLTTVLGALILLAILCTWSMGTARYGGPDEPAHVLRAAAVANGQIYGELAPGLPPGYRSVLVPATLATGDPACFRLQPARNGSCSQATTRPGMVSVATSAANYPPLYYALLGYPAKWLGGASDAGTYRLMAAIGNWFVLILVAARLRCFGERALVMLATITPAAWFLSGVVNPNGLEIALIALAWVGVAQLGQSHPSVGALMWIGGPMAVAIAVRPVAIFACAAIFVVVICARVGWRQLAILGIPPTFAIVAVEVWNMWIGLTVSDSRTRVSATPSAALWHSLASLPTALNQAIGSLSWLELQAPWPVVALWGATAAATAGVGLLTDRGSRHGPWWLWLGSLVLAPIVFTLATYSRIGYIWQGRYSIPILIGLAALYLRSPEVPSARPGWKISGLWLGTYVIGEITTFWVALRRYVVGTNGSWWFAQRAPGDPNNQSARWEPSLPPLVLLSTHIVLVLALSVIASAAFSGSASLSGSDDTRPARRSAGPERRSVTTS